MNDNQFYYIPKRLNEPMRLIIFTLDEIVPAGMVFVIAVFAGYMLFGVILAAVVMYFVKKFKAGRSRDYFKRKLYWHGLNPMVKNQHSRKRAFFRGASFFDI